MGTGIAAVRSMRRARLRHWRPAPLDLASFAVGAGIVLLFSVSAVRAASASQPAASPAVSARTAALVAGLAAAVAVVAAVTSGVRGGPLALGSATVFLVLLAPVDRAAALRSAAMRQVVLAALAGAAVAAVGWVATANQVARPRGQLDQWVLGGGLVGALCAGIALLAAGARLGGGRAIVVRISIIAWWVVDAAAGIVTSPLSALAQLPFEPRDPLRVASALGLTACVVVVGVLRIGGLSVERTWRRTAAADQLRVAVGLNDLRTAVLVLRRRAQELPRTRPWRRTEGRWSRHHPIAARSVRGLMRWPLARAIRFTVLAMLAGTAVAAAGRVPAFAVVASMFTYAAALDASDALSQELDHPDLGRGYPVTEGRLVVQHVPVPLVVMTIFGALASASAGAVAGLTALLTGLLVSPLVALAAMAGAALTASRIARPLLSVVDYGRPPEFVVPRIALQVLAPLVPLVATVLPVALALRASPDVWAATAALPGAAVSLAFLGFVLLRSR